jgi:hypothetical protein
MYLVFIRQNQNIFSPIEGRRQENILILSDEYKIHYSYKSRWFTRYFLCVLPDTLFGRNCLKNVTLP